MQHFEIYAHEFELEGLKYKLRPVSGKHIGLLIKVVGKFENNEEFKISDLDEETVTSLHTLVLETFLASYPEKRDNPQQLQQLDQFVSQKLFKLIEPVFKVNMTAME